MSAAPLVSVVIPAYNSADFITEAIQSVRAQTYPRIEIVVVDDGSTDETPRRLAEFGRQIVLIRQENKGPAVARNAGIRASGGEFVAFLDADDLWLPEKTERCIAALQAHPKAGVAYTGVLIREVETGREYPLEQYARGGWMARDLFLECKGVNTSTLVVRRACLDAIGGFDEDFFRAQDWDLMLRLAEKYPYAHVSDRLVIRRMHARSLGVARKDLYAKYNLLVIEKALARQPRLYQGLADESLARAHFRFGMLHYSDYRLAAAREEFRRSLAHAWKWTVFNYLLRAYLPPKTIRRLREWRLRRQGQNE